MAEVDELFSLRNHFCLGNYQLAINEAGTLNRLNDTLKVEKDVYVYRSYIAMGQYDIVLDEVSDKDSTAAGLRAVKLLAKFMSDPSNKADHLADIKKWQSDPAMGNNPTIQIVAAYMFIAEGMFKEALQSVRHGSNLEQLAAQAQIFLRMDRVDLCEKTVKQMADKDDEASQTQLATAWLYMYQGGPKFQEAAYLYQELGDKFGISSLILNGQAAANLHQKNFEEAERLLMEASGKSSTDPDTLVNQIVVSQHLNKGAQVTGRLISQLKREHPTHAFVQALAVQEGAFDRVAAGFGSA
jgi:coatomer protein complex subunit epsilon